MDYRPIGGTGVKVSRLCLGATMFGAWGNIDHDECVRITGKARYLGSSTFPPSAIVEAQWVAERRNCERFVGEQPPYPIFVGGWRRTCCRRAGATAWAFVAWSPHIAGWLTSKYHKGQDPPEGSRAARGRMARFDAPENARRLDLVEVAADAGVTLTHLAPALVVGHQAVTSAILGPRTMGQLTDPLAGQDVVLDDAALDRIDERVAPGTDVHAGDAGWTSPALAPTARRR